MTHTVAADAGRRRFTLLPTTGAGRLAAWLALAFLVWFALNQAYIGVYGTDARLPPAPLVAVVMVLGLAGLATGLAAGIAALVAIARQRERSVIVMVALIPALMTGTLLLGELLIPH